ncbi:NUDIX hydrolase [Haliangium ochraceum]|uniref:NUDIX hydrolase n=1 Tax=Haliangium ochraceum (strain DSM 14365 / JCM 11303 / SMP-2) TaxID=502025 RepID=D0LXZ2_HALO1|nr:NUDIX hydrolase [Haliangium ochraceum]ACY14347.1 NUDIX hydrolase [Haliangium ochraceum DSM 14365]
MQPTWLDWARRLLATAQTGLHYARDPYDIERYEAMRALAVEIIEAHTGETGARLEALFREQSGYATPKIDVRGAVFRDDRILLVHERADGAWTMPGGWADVGDTPAQAVEREIREESGFEARALKLIAVYDRDAQGHPPAPFAIYKMYFLCELLGGEARTSTETAGAAFYAEDELPPLSLGRVLPKHIERAFAHYRSPSLPTEFD